MKHYLRIIVLVLVWAQTGCSSGVKEWVEGDDYRLRGDRRYRMGYAQARSDRVKNDFWREQDRSAAAAAGQEEHGRQVYYTLPGPSEGPAGEKLVPHPVTVPVVE